MTLGPIFAASGGRETAAKVGLVAVGEEGSLGGKRRESGGGRHCILVLHFAKGQDVGLGEAHGAVGSELDLRFARSRFAPDVQRPT